MTPRVLEWLAQRGVPVRGVHDVAARLGRHVVTGELGAGGMGRVLDVHDPVLDRGLAAKVLRGEDATPAQRHVFVREAITTGQLAHPNIVPVHEVAAERDGQVYFTMRRIDGGELGDLARDALDPSASRSSRREGTPLVTVLQAFLKVCDALAFAHSRGVIHRDLKPANVMVGPFGEVLVCDWGLACRAGDDPLREALTLDTAPGAGPLQTLTGQIVGTPAYMPPEQAEGRIDALDARSDVYSLGAILYELLTGRPPFVGATPWAVLSALLERPPTPPSVLRPDLAPELEAIVLRAMARRPSDRYASVGALRDDVEAFLAGGVVDAARYTLAQRLGRFARRHRAALGVAAALLVGVVVTAAAVTLQARRERQRQLRALVEAAGPAVAAGPEVRALLAFGEMPVDRTRESPGQRARREALLRAHLEAASALDRALRLSDDPTLREQRVGVGRRIARLAIRGGDPEVARWALAGLRAHGVSDAQRTSWQAHLDAVLERAGQRTELRLAEIVADLRAGLRRDDRAPGAPTLDELVWEVASYREPIVVARLGAILDGLATRGTRREWPPAERDLAVFACRVLGRLEMPSAVAPLGRWLAAVRDPELIVVAGVALCDTRQASAYVPLVRKRMELGSESSIWDRIEPHFRRVPEGTLDDGGEHAPLRAYNRGLTRAAQGRFREAIADYERAIELDPVWALPHNGLGLCHRRLGQLAEAQRHLERAIELDPRQPLFLGNLGAVRAERGDLEAALRDFARALSIAPDARTVLLQRANAYIRYKRYADALPDATAAVRIDPDDNAALLMQARLFAFLHRHAEAVAVAGKALTRDPRDGLAWFLRGQSRHMLGRHAEAIRDLDRARELLADDPVVYAVRAAARASSGDPDGGEDDVQRALALDANSVKAQHALLLVYRARKQWTHALAQADKLLALPGGDKQAVYHLDRAYALSALGRYADALAGYRTALPLLRTAADKATCVHNIGNQHLRLGQRKEAIRQYERAAELDPTVSLYHLKIGINRQREGDLDGALAAMTRAIEVEPGSANNYSYRAALHAARKDLKAALADIVEAVHHRGKWNDHFSHGSILLAMGRPAEALVALRTSRPIAPAARHAVIDREIAKAEKALKARKAVREK